MEIRGIQPADHAVVDNLLETLDDSKKHLGQEAAKLRQDKNYLPILEVVEEENNQLTGTASLHEISLNDIVCLMVGPIRQIDDELTPLVSELKKRALESGYRFIIWQQFDEVDPTDFGFKPAVNYDFYLPGQEDGTENLYVYQLVKDSLDDVFGEVEFTTE